MSTLILPYSIWPQPLLSPADRQQARQLLQAPHWQTWVNNARVQAVNWLPAPSDDHPDGERLNTPFEWALAYAQGLLEGHVIQDGQLPWAAMRAAQSQRQAPPDHGWAQISWCHWQVSQTQIIVLPPEVLKIDQDLDNRLFALMQPFFADVGVTLYQNQPGHWLAHAREFTHLRCASLERMLNRPINAWHIHASQGHSDALKRLQNEVQMFLYTHDINASRDLSINSFWLHGTGEAAQTGSAPDVLVWDDLRPSALNQDVGAWMQAWALLDQRLLECVTDIDRCIFCGESSVTVLARFKPNRWQQCWRALGWRGQPPALFNVLFSDDNER